MYLTTSKPISLPREECISWLEQRTNQSPRMLMRLHCRNLRQALPEVRSISQYKAGLVKTFKTKEEFLDHLKNLE